MEFIWNENDRYADEKNRSKILVPGRRIPHEAPTAGRAPPARNRTPADSAARMIAAAPRRRPDFPAAAPLNASSSTSGTPCSLPQHLRAARPPLRTPVAPRYHPPTNPGRRPPGWSPRAPPRAPSPHRTLMSGDRPLGSSGTAQHSGSGKFPGETHFRQYPGERCEAARYRAVSPRRRPRTAG